MPEHDEQLRLDVRLAFAASMIEGISGWVDRLLAVEGPAPARGN
jgi:hypothetical protein